MLASDFTKAELVYITSIGVFPFSPVLTRMQSTVPPMTARTVNEFLTLIRAIYVQKRELWQRRVRGLGLRGQGFTGGVQVPPLI